MAENSPTSKRPLMAPGWRYGRLVALKLVKRRRITAEGKVIPARWRFQCDCGNKHVTDVPNVRRGHTASCGCLMRDRTREAHRRNGPRIKHGMTGTPEYQCWRNMISRCTNDRRKDYRLYGGRGITVCERWRSSFEAFFADMGPKPSPQHSIDRYPKKDGNYKPGNCRWATASEQRINQRASRLVMVTYGGKQMTLKEACDLSGAEYFKTRLRLKRGWPLARALAS